MKSESHDKKIHKERKRTGVIIDYSFAAEFSPALIDSSEWTTYAFDSSLSFQSDALFPSLHVNASCYLDILSRIHPNGLHFHSFFRPPF
jgi:hypothetical protein